MAIPKKEILRLNRSLLEASYPHLIAGKKDMSVMYIQRFEVFARLLHITMILSFLTLAITGMSLKFSYAPWAVTVSGLLGGYEAMGILHRVAAAVMFADFGVHFIYVRRKWRESGKSLRAYVFGRESIIPNLNDLKELIGTTKWFFGLGPQPAYGHWTYWEKFDYFAVFWGVGIIGLTGLTMWFPEFFTRWIPGHWINIANIIHSDEALLASGFIFTVHFFNTHFRPEKFPMDPVIFTGQVPLEEFKHERPHEYEQLLKDGKLNELLSNTPAPKWVRILIRLFGFTALTIGISLIVGIIYAMVFVYK
ncbi:MAG: hypothetical protein Q8N12_04225 [Thermodesulfovibrionales bacterium]|nr:hypothetical protein [Thermodesulfovibrionales bacterium]